MEIPFTVGQRDGTTSQGGENIVFTGSGETERRTPNPLTVGTERGFSQGSLRGTPHRWKIGMTHLTVGKIERKIPLTPC